MPRTRWAHVLSLELGWMTPGQATNYVEKAVAAGLLKERGDDLEISYDPASVEMPRGFRPDPTETPSAVAAGDPFVEWLEKVAAATKKTRAQVLADIEERQTRMGGMLTADAAVLWAAADAGLDVRIAAGTALKALTATAGKRATEESP